MVLADRATAAYDRSMLLAPDVAPPPAIVRAHCPAGYAHVRCGFVRVPLDHQNPTGPTIRVYFERYLRRDRRDPAATTVVAIEGGPGYATTGSRDSYRALWRPVSRHRDLLLVDLRGTGRSGALACKAFANHVTNYNVRAGRCATQLGLRRRYYDTSQSVQDIASVLRAIRAGPVDLYGDSYGSYAAQAFAVRYPHRLRSLVLDSTYPVPGTDPAFADLALRSREAMRLACSRWPNCPVSDPVSQLRGLVQSVRADPIVGNAPDGDGTRQHVVVDERTLATTIQVIYGNLGVLRDLPAAIASSRAGDNRPLLRLVAENGLDVDYGADPTSFSEALYLSVICHDYPQPWPAGTPLSARAATAQSTFAGYPASAFDPFSVGVWTGLDNEGALACVNWPQSPSQTDPPIPDGAAYPNVPTLILNGDLDNITPLEDAQQVASNFPNTKLLVIQNVNHIQALGDQYDCASRIYTRFVKSLHTGNTSCASHTAPVRVVRRFPLKLAEVDPATADAGDATTADQRRVAAAAAETASDVISRWWVNYDGTSVGLRGGTWSYGGGDLTTFHLHKVQWLPGLRVSGQVRWRYSTGAVAVNVTTAGDGAHEHLVMHWSLATPYGQARIRGSAGGHTLAAHMLSP
jgi:pimeloyl-ACP methyl ester carboxylesterase